MSFCAAACCPAAGLQGCTAWYGAAAALGRPWLHSHLRCLFKRSEVFFVLCNAQSYAAALELADPP